MPKKMMYDERIDKAQEFIKTNENRRAIYQLEKAIDLKPSASDELEAIILNLEKPKKKEPVILKMDVVTNKGMFLKGIPHFDIDKETLKKFKQAGAI